MHIKCITVGNGALTTILVIWIPRNPIYQQGIQGWFEGELKLVDLSARVENLSARLPLQTNIVWLTKTKLELGSIKEQCSGGSLLGGIGNGHLAQCSRSRGNASHGSFHCSQAGRGCRLSGWQSWRGGGAGAGGSIASSIYSLFLFCRQQPASVLPPLPTQHCVYST